MPMPSLFAALRARGSGTPALPAPNAGRYAAKTGASTNTAKKGQTTTVKGRQGASKNPAQNAGSNVFQFSDTLSTSNVKSYPLTADGDYVSATFTISVTATGNTTATVDILNAFAQMIIYGPDGPIVTLQPLPDFYMISQRFSELHVKPTVVTTSNASAHSGTYYVAGLSLPANRGPYTLQISIAAASGFSATATALSVTTQVEMTIGDCGGKRTRYMYSGLPFTPTASGVNDLAPLAPIQDTPLVELFFSGLTSDTADINYIQILSGGATQAPRVSSGALVGLANQQMTTALDSDKLFPLLALQTDLTLGRAAHFYLNWGATPSSTIRNGFYWLD